MTIDEAVDILTEYEILSMLSSGFIEKHITPEFESKVKEAIDVYAAHKADIAIKILKEIMNENK
jgi:hypothetical protein